MDPKISESKLFSPATCSSLSPEELHVQGHLSMASYENFMEAICRFALFRQEVFICKGSFDVCPRQMTSEKCTCEYEQIAHQLDIQLFYQAVQEVIKSLNRNRLRRSMRYQRVLNLRTNDMMMTSSTSSSLPSLASPSSTRSISPTQSSSCW
jgi:hypothetical protein